MSVLALARPPFFRPSPLRTPLPSFRFYFSIEVQVAISCEGRRAAFCKPPSVQACVPTTGLSSGSKRRASHASMAIQARVSTCRICVSHSFHFSPCFVRSSCASILYSSIFALAGWRVLAERAGRGAVAGLHYSSAVASVGKQPSS